MPKKTHKQRVDEQEARYREQLSREPTAKEQLEAREQRAVALQKEALIAEIRRQRAVGQSLDLQAALEAARGGQLQLTAAIAQGDLSKVAMAEWYQFIRVLQDRAQNAPDLTVQMECADRGAQHTFNMLEMLARNSVKPVRGGYVEAPSESTADGLTREEKIALVRRQLAAEGM